MRVSPRESLRFSGRTFSPEELEWLKGLLCSESLTRQQLSRRVCQELNWINRAGRLKEMSCRVALLRMERVGLIDLPAPLHPNTNGLSSKKEWTIPKPDGPCSPR